MTGLLKRYGFRGLVLKTLERRQSPMLAYTKNYRNYMPAAEELKEQKNRPLFYAPLVSIVVPAYETPEIYLRELIGSVLAQSYPNWELCIADGSRTSLVKETTEEYAVSDARIRYLKLPKNGGISENTNGGFAMAKGDYIALMDHDDLLTENALYEMIRCLNCSYAEEERHMAMIYSDEDKINGDGSVHSRPHFKPDFNPEFLRRNNYFCHFLMFSKELLQKAGGLKKEYDGAQDYDFVLRCVDAGAVVNHVPRILYHWRIHEGSTAGNSADKAYAFDNGCRAIEAHLKRCKEPGRAKVTANLGVYQVDYDLAGTYRITVAAESKEQLEKVKRHYQKMPFADKPYNFQIHYLYTDSFYNGIEKKCSGDYILYIRKDVSADPRGLLEKLLGLCQHEHTGLAGAKIITPKGRVLSCGLIYDENGKIIPSCGGILAEFKGYFLHAVIPQNVSAVPFACVMLRRDALVKLKGVDTSLTGIRRDADYCFRLQENGYRVAVTPEITAVSHKSNLDKDNFAEQETAFYEKWKQKLKHPDPCYNCNLSLIENHTYAMKSPQE